MVKFELYLTRDYILFLCGPGDLLGFRQIAILLLMQRNLSKLICGAQGLPKPVQSTRGRRNRLGIDRGTSKLVRTFNRSMIALLEKKVGQKENRSRKKSKQIGRKIFHFHTISNAKFSGNKNFRFFFDLKNFIFIQFSMKKTKFSGLGNFRRPIQFLT